MTRLFFRTILIGLTATSVFGQLVPVGDTDGLTEGRIRLDYESHTPGTHGGELFSGRGVHVYTSDASPVLVDNVTFGVVGIELRFLSNSSQDESSTVVVDFGLGVKEFGVVLRGPESTTATLSAFDPLGSSLGSLQQAGLDPDFGQFAGFRTSRPGGATKVIIDYGSVSDAEQIVEIYYNPVTPSSFVSYLAQLADGAIPGVGALQSVLIITNLTNTTSQGQVQIIGDGGEPLELEFSNGETFSSNTFDLAPFASVSWTTAGTASPPVQGYARISSTSPLDGTAVFQLVNTSGVPTSEAGVGASTARSLLIGAVTLNAEKKFDSGIAISNGSDETADVNVTLVRPDGTAAGSTNLELGPGTHQAAFVTGLFPSLFNQDFEGTMVISSDQPVAVVILRTINGLVLSSLPVGSTQR